MKKLRIILIAVVMMCCALGLAACQKPALRRPTGLRLDADFTTLYWTHVTGATSYKVEVDGKQYEAFQNEFSLKELSLEGNKEHTFRVKAVAYQADNSNSDWSVTLKEVKPFDNGLKFRLINGNTEYEVLEVGDATGSEIEIPSTYRGLPVTSISNGAFYNTYSLNKVIIPESVTTIGTKAFQNCSQLSEVVLPDTVTTIGESAFQSCRSLKSIKLPAALQTVSQRAFFNCRALSEVEFDPALVYISDNAFYGCEKLASIDLSGTQVMAIGVDAFAGCIGMTSAKLSSTVQSIGEEAFRACTALTEVDFGDSLIEIGNSAFRDCIALNNVDLPDSLVKVGETAFYACTSLDNVHLGSGLQYISNYAFQLSKIWNDEDDIVYVDNWLIKDKNTEHETVTIRPGTVGIAAYAFFYHYQDYVRDEKGEIVYEDEEKKTPQTYEVYNKLKNITIPSHVKYIDEYAFYCCVDLENLTLEDGIEVIDVAAFANCGFKSVNIPGSVKTISSGAFESNTKLVSVTLNEGTEMIGEYAFADCALLEDIELNIPTLKNIDSYAFSYDEKFGGSATNPEPLTLPDSLERIGYGAFWGTAYWDSTRLGAPVYAGNWLVGYVPNASSGDEEVKPAEVTINPGTVGICDYAFYRTSDVSTVKFSGNSLKHLGRSAFYQSTSLSSINIPSGLTEISDYTFYGCSALTNVTLPETVTSIGRSAFYGCTSLEYISDLTHIEYIGDYAFFRTMLSTVKFGNVLNYLGNRAFYSSQIISLEISGIEEIGDYTFYKCESLKNVTVGEGVKKIGKYAFGDCVSLESVTLTDVTAIDDYAFRGCTKLVDLDLGENLESIGKSSFVLCSALETVHFPTSLSSIDNMAFRDCTSLKSIVLPKSIDTMGMHIFYRCELLTIYTEWESIPEGWHQRWNTQYSPVLMGCLINNGYVVSYTKDEGTYANVYSSPIETLVMLPIREGYTFKGWATDFGGSVIYEVEQKDVTVTSEGPEGEVIETKVTYDVAPLLDISNGTTLYAVWEQNI